MTLTISSNLKSRRTYLNTKLSHRKTLLLRAYITKDQSRINRNKLSLARILHELAESPELGPKPIFKWGQLEIVYRGNFDPDISWAMCEASKSDPYLVACLLERSVFNVQDLV
jgi:hypothetical protein